jgi:hypothetical protein
LLVFERNGIHKVADCFSGETTQQPKHLIHPDIFRMYAPKDSHVIFYENRDGGFNAVSIPFSVVSGQ